MIDMICLALTLCLLNLPSTPAPAPPTPIILTPPPITAKVTAYCSGYVTSRGKTPSRGTIAVDPKRIPYGTRIVVPGYGIGIASDTGGDMRNYDGIHLDVYMHNHADAMAWGVRYLPLYIVPPAHSQHIE